MRLVKAAGKPAAAALVSFFVACTSADAPASAGSPQYVAGGPHRTKGRNQRPRASLGYQRVGVASWYGAAFHGRRTASGERFDMNALTAAHRSLPLSTMVRVTNLDNGRSIAVRINDRGPFARGRIIDLSRAGARALGFDRRGTARVRVSVLDEGTMRAERDGEGEGNGATMSGGPEAPRLQGQGPRGQGRGRPDPRPTYVRLGAGRGRQAAPSQGNLR